MTDKISHRGPDGEGFYFDQSLSLGHRRLSIIDLSEKANQPMIYKDYIIIFNGEIYNFQKIKQQLIQNGHNFESDSDTEVLLHAYEEWGTSCVNQLNGMWAFCLYDKNKNLLFLSRDRFGEKPLYYFFNGNQFIFSSELKAIRAHDLNLQINENALNFYFYQKYIGKDLAIFKNVFKLKPAHNLYFNLQTKSLEISQYYNLDSEIQLAKTLEVSQRLKEIKELIPDAVEKRLISDVPVGSFLSGGVDSSLISAIIAKNHSDFDTFSIGFKEKSFDELPYSKIVADHIKTNHLWEFSEINEDIIKHIIENMDEPFGDSSVIPTYLLSQITKKKVTVSLSGDAGDEVFGGYDTYLAHKIILYFPEFLMGLCKNLLKIIPPSDKKVTLAFKAKRFFENYNKNINHRHFNWMATFKEDERKKLLADYLSDNALLDFPDEKNDITVVQLNDLTYYLAEDILKKVDSASMLNSLEARVPFLDHRLVPLVLSLPEKYKIRRLSTKWLLKDIAKSFIPAQIINRKKRGFTVPVSTWIKNSTFISKCLTEDFYFEHKLLNKEFVLYLYNTHISNKKDYARQLWLVFVFNYWWVKNMRNAV